MNNETWRVVPSAPWFLASSEGRIMVIPYEAKMPFGGTRQYGGQPHFGVWNKTDERFTTVHKGKTYRIAPLICEAFSGPKPFPKAVCMHMDENSANNRFENLQWGTQKENLNAPKYISSVRTRPFSAQCKCCAETFEPRYPQQSFCSVRCSSFFNNKARAGLNVERIS